MMFNKKTFVVVGIVAVVLFDALLIDRIPDAWTNYLEELLGVNHPGDDALAADDITEDRGPAILVGGAYVYLPVGQLAITLSPGMTENKGVTELQAGLKILGFLPGNVVGGTYDKTTVEAVRNFQMSQGISPADGIFGPKTLVAFNKLIDINNAGRY